jgi:hypothetical protein
LARDAPEHASLAALAGSTAGAAAIQRSGQMFVPVEPISALSDLAAQDASSRHGRRWRAVVVPDLDRPTWS